jgi:thiamine kinase-like enzyme
MGPGVEEKIQKLPCWNGGISISPLTGGLSNENFLVSDANGKYVVRFGVDYPFHHVLRERENMVARAAHVAGLAPAVKYAASGVLVTQYIGAKTFAASDVRTNAARVGQLIRQFHDIMPQKVTGPGFMFWVFHVIRDYAHILNDKDVTAFLTAADALEKQQIPLPIIFGHNDLLPANILDDGQKLWLIDFEYAGFGTALFDLAGASSNAQMNEDEQQMLMTAYFGQAPDAALRKSFSAMECASLLRETLWAMVSHVHLSAPGVDYAAYTVENLTRYNVALEQHQKTYGKLLT